jgi:ferredoxin
MPTVSLKKVASPELNIELNERNITLYEHFEAAGHEIPHGCLSGSCGACKVEVTKGEENLSRPGAIEQDTIESLQSQFPDAKDIRLACRAKIMELGNIELEIF